MKKKKFRILSMLKPIQEAVDKLEKFGEIEIGTSLTRNEILDHISNFDAVLADDEFAYDKEFLNIRINLRSFPVLE